MGQGVGEGVIFPVSYLGWRVIEIKGLGESPAIQGKRAEE